MNVAELLIGISIASKTNDNMSVHVHCFQETITMSNLSFYNRERLDDHSKTTSRVELLGQVILFLIILLAIVLQTM
ncbi:MAG TPA: hypothetical protein DIW81_07925 [Planctomycetaceae bacterium]|nr:hypothetical protein [Planctomycetaceae bacterium]